MQPHIYFNSTICDVQHLPQLIWPIRLQPASRYLRAVVLAWVHSPEGFMHMGGSCSGPEAAATIITNCLCIVTHAFGFTLRSDGSLSLPVSATPDDVHHSDLLRNMSAAATWVTGKDFCDMLELAPANQRHVIEWLEATDYAAQALVMMAGLVGLDAGVIPSPEGEFIRRDRKMAGRQWLPARCPHLISVLRVTQHVCVATAMPVAGLLAGLKTSDAHVAEVRGTIVESIVFVYALVGCRLSQPHLATGSPGSRAATASLALLAAWLCSDVEAKQAQQQLDDADRKACMLLLREVMPALRLMAAIAGKAGAGAVAASRDAESAAAEASTQQEGSQPGISSEQPGGSAHPGVQPTPGDTAGSSATPSLPPIDITLLTMMAAARVLKVAAQLSCCGRHCACCGRWEARSSGDCTTSANSSSSSRPSTTTGASSTQHAVAPDGSEACPNHRQRLEPGLQEVEEVAAALGDLLSLACSLCQFGSDMLRQEAASQHPLLYLQALLSTMQVRAQAEPACAEQQVERLM
jgi:hypothetical protein